MDAGDGLFENYYLVKGKEPSSKLKAKTVLESTVKMGNYIYNVGQSDFAAGIEFLREMEETAGTHFISSNLVNVGTNELTFNDHTILERNGLKIGIFGITTEIPDVIKTVEVKDYVSVAKSKVDELRPQVDVLVMLLNATKPQSDKAMEKFAGIDYIFSSRETSRTRPERLQSEDHPKQYCLGIQGKYVGRFDLKVSDINKPIRDVTSSVMTVKVFEERLVNLQKRNPDKPLEEVYKNNPNVLNMVQKFKSGVKESKGSMENAANSSYYTLIPLNGSVVSEKSLLAVVDQALKTCETLDKEGSSSLP